MIERVDRRRLALGAALIGIGYLALLLATARDVGYTRDEGFYFSAARGYQGWFDLLGRAPGEALSAEGVDRHFAENHEHPVLMKLAFGFSERLFATTLGWLDAATALRLPAMLTAAATLALLWWWGTRLAGPLAGLGAALLFGLMPRFFFHAHLACFDVPITFFWTLTLYLYSRSLASPGHGLAAGVAFGLALAVKLNAFFLPLVCGLHWLAVWWWRRRRGLPRPSLSAFAAGIVLAPAIFLAHWPWLWHDTFKRLGAYLAFHAHHVHYNTAWFGENIVAAPTPIALPLVMTLLTVPTVTILLAALGGLGLAARRDGGAPDADRRLLLVTLGLIIPILVVSLPHVPKFGGTKHWMNALPGLALFAGIGLARLATAGAGLVPSRLGRLAPTLLVALVLASPLAQTLASHPFGLASYVPLAGGAPGAARLGMTRQFWGYTTRDVLPWLDGHAPDGAGVFFHDSQEDAVAMYREEGSLRRDLRNVGVAASRIALVHHELHMVRNEAWIWNSYGTITPSHVLTYQGVPLVSIYVRPASAPAEVTP